MKALLQSILDLDLRASQRVRVDPAACAWWGPATLLAHSGDSWFWASGMALLWLLGNPYWRHLAAIFEIGIVLQALLVFALKQTIRRQRPVGEWGSIYRSIDPHSFPSGHAARAALLAVLAISLGPAWFGWLIGLWAPVMALSRVITGVHYISDILGGIVFGLLFGLLVLALSPLIVQYLPFLFF